MAIDDVDITLLVDDASNSDLTAEHGLSVWIETTHHHILFDTGQGPALATNAELLNIDLSQTQFLVLSHGHYDHTGGIPHVLQCNRDIELFCHPCAVQPRYNILSDVTKSIHMPRASMAALDKHSNRRLHWVSEPVRLCEDIGLTGPIPRKSTFEDDGGPFFLDPNGRRKDHIDDDMALWINTSKGLVVFMGCCHAGLTNTLHHIRHLSGVSTIRAVIGGFHLTGAGPKRIAQTLSGLEEMDPAVIVACHCTGEKAVATFRTVLNGRVSKGYAGMRLIFR